MTLRNFLCSLVSKCLNCLVATLLLPATSCFPCILFMLGTIVVHNWQVVRRTVALGFFSPVCVCTGHQVLPISFFRRCALTFPHSWTPTATQDLWPHTHKEGEPKGTVSQRRKCQCEQDLCERDHLTPLSTETPVHQLWTVNPWHTHTEAAYDHKLLIQYSQLFHCISYLGQKWPKIIRRPNKNRTLCIWFTQFSYHFKFHY